MSHRALVIVVVKASIAVEWYEGDVTYLSIMSLKHSPIREAPFYKNASGLTGGHAMLVESRLQAGGDLIVGSCRTFVAVGSNCNGSFSIY